jgi:NADPH:quinone reductase
LNAVWLRAFGPPSALAVEQTPEPDGALIAVEFANITFVETQVRAGRAPFPVSLPMILGNGVGGVLDGRRVVASLGGSGGYAEYAVGVEVFDVPDSVALDDAVALLADGRTAMLLTDAAAIEPGERVLVLAAAGGVGTLLVQLAARAGATVIAVASSARKRELAASLGAAETVAYGRGVPADVVLDGVGGTAARHAFAKLSPGGRMLSYGLASGAWADITAADAAARGVTLVKAGRPERSHTERALRSGLRPVIGQRFALQDAARAHATMEARQALGKTLLAVE